MYFNVFDFAGMFLKSLGVEPQVRGCITFPPERHALVGGALLMATNLTEGDRLPVICIRLDLIVASVVAHRIKLPTSGSPVNNLSEVEREGIVMRPGHSVVFPDGLGVKQLLSLLGDRLD